MKTKRTRYLKFKFILFVIFLCIGTVSLGYGFHQVHSASIQTKQADPETKESEPAKKTIQMVQLQKKSDETTEDTIDDIGADPTENPSHLILVYEEADETSEILEEVFTGEWAQYIAESEGFVEVKTNAGTTGFVTAEQAKVTSVEEKTASMSLKDVVVLLDPGHGGEDGGAVSTNQVYLEKDLTLDTAKAVKNALEEAGATVYLTREDDDFLSLDDRTEMAIENSVDIFISLHYDSFETSDTMSGYTTYYYYDASEALANNINQGLLDNITSLNNVGLRTDNFEVIRETPYPSVLLELGYINSYGDLIVIREDSYYTEVADGIVEGLESYFNQ